jgi:hypothetical protein
MMTTHSQNQKSKTLNLAKSGMGGECFMCGQSAQGRYTLVLDNSKIIEDVVVCEECISDLRNTEWIKVYE